MLKENPLSTDSPHHSEITATNVYLGDRLRHLDVLFRHLLVGGVRDSVSGMKDVLLMVLWGLEELSVWQIDFFQVTQHTIGTLLANAEKIYGALKLWEHWDKVVG